VISAARFLYSIALDSYGALHESEVSVEIGHVPTTTSCEADAVRFVNQSDTLGSSCDKREQLQVRVFRAASQEAQPLSPSSSSSGGLSGSLPSVFVLHGFCASGAQDERVIQLARSLASAGYIALLPTLPPLRNCYIGRACIDAIVRASLAVLSRPDLCPSHKLSYAAACISAGMALIAAAQPILRAHINAFLLIGTYATVENVAAFTMGAACDDNYGRNAMFLNFGHVAWGGRQSGSTKQLEQILLASLHVNHFETQNKPHLLAEARRTLDELLAQYPREAAQYHKLETDPEFRVETSARMISILNSPLRREDRILSFLSPLEWVPQLGERVSVCMMHGENDCVVNASESVLLFKASKQASREASLCITPLIDHGTKDAFRPSAIFEVLRLFKVVYTFSRRARRV